MARNAAIRWGVILLLAVIASSPLFAQNTLTCSATTPRLGEVVTCTASFPGGAATDTVFFFNNDTTSPTLLGSGSLNAGLTASFSTALLPVGSHTLGATNVTGTGSASTAYAVNVRPTSATVTLGAGSAEYGSTLSASASLQDAGPAIVAGTAPAALTPARFGHTATLLPNGTVLILGGTNGTALDGGGEVYNPATGAFAAPVNGLAPARAYHTATLLNDGKVLVVGGATDGNATGTTSFATLFDPATGTYAAPTGTNPSPIARSHHSATLLANGNVLIVGGLDSTGAPIGTVEIYDSVNQTFTTAPVGQSVTPRYGHTATLLNDGTVLLAGGSATTGGTAAVSAIYTVGAGAVPTIGDLNTSRTDHSATLLPDGSVLITGGTSGSTTNTGEEIFDPVSNTFFALGTTLGTARSGHTVTALHNGNLLIAGGTNGTAAVSASERYLPKFDPLFDSATLTLGSDGSDTIGNCNLEVPVPGTGTTSCQTTITVGAVGTGTHTITAHYAGSNTHATSSGSSPFTDTAAPLTVTANNDTKTFGQARTYGAGSTSFTSAGLKNGETIGSVTITASGGAAANAPVGTYTLTPSAATGGTFTAGNYAITYVAGTLTVNAAVLTVTANNDTKSYGQSRTYGAGSTAFSATGLQNGETIGSVTITASGGALATDPIGTYTLTPSGATGGTFIAGNYTVSYANGTLTVNPAALDITANSDTKTYGQTRSYGAGSTAFTSTGLQNGQTIGSVTITASGGTLATDAAGSYALIPSAATGGTFLASNYTVNYHNGTLTVDTAPLTITANNDSKTYGDTKVYGSGSTAFTVTGLLNADAVNTVTLTSAGAVPTAPVSGSPYAIVASAPVGTGLTNYNIAYVNGVLTVARKALSITAVNQSKTYGLPGNLGTALFTTNGLVNADAVSAVALTSAGTAADAPVAGSPFPIIPSAAVGTGLDNYDVTYGNASLTVNADQTFSVFKDVTAGGAGDTPTTKVFNLQVCPQSTPNCTNLGGGFPTGTVQLSDGATSLGQNTIAAAANGATSFKIDVANLAPSTSHAFSAAYTPDTTNFTGSTASRTQTVSVSAVSFTLVGQAIPAATTTANAILDQNNHVIDTTVTFSCEVDATFAISNVGFGCTVAGTGDFTAANSVPITVSFVPATTGTVMAHNRHSDKLRGVIWSGVSGLSMLAIFIPFLSNRRRLKAHLARLISGGLIVLCLGFFVACGSGGFNNTGNQGGTGGTTVAGNYVAVVYGQGAQTGKQIYAVVPIQVNH